MGQLRKLRTVIEKKMFSNTEELLPVISFSAKASEEDEKKHANFVSRMVEKGYTEKQVGCCASGTCASQGFVKGRAANSMAQLIDRRPNPRARARLTGSAF